MKESTFMELLNLYIDQQISPEDAARLEDEIQSNARRRLVYQQYCKMHRACTIVLGNYGTTTEAETAAEFRPQARRPAWGYYAAGLAAACVALVAAQVYLRPVRLTAPSAPAAIPVAAAPAADQSVVSVPVRFDVPAARNLGNDNSFEKGLLLRLPAFGKDAPMLVMVDAPTARVSLRPLSISQPAPSATRSSIEQFVFQPEAPALDNPQIFRVRQSTDGKEEMTAYQFQR